MSAAGSARANPTAAAGTSASRPACAPAARPRSPRQPAAARPRRAADVRFHARCSGDDGWAGDGYELVNAGTIAVPEQAELPLEAAAARCRRGRANPRRPSPIRRRRWRRRSRCPTRRWPGRAPSARWRRAIRERWQRGQLLHELLRHLPAIAAGRARRRRRGASSPSRRTGWRRGDRRLEPPRRWPSPRRRRTPRCSPKARAPRCR